MTRQKTTLSASSFNSDTFNLLNQEQLNQLDSLLNQLNSAEDEANVYFALGYVTALGLLGKPLQPQAWQEDLFTDAATLDKDKVQTVLSLLERAAKQAQQSFAQDISPHPPAEFNFVNHSEVLADWCSGFMLAIFNNELDDDLDEEVARSLAAREASSCELVTSKLVCKKKDDSAANNSPKKGSTKKAIQQPKPLTEKQKEAMPELLFPIMALSGLFDEEEEFIEVSADRELLEEFSEDLGEVLLDLYCLIHAPEER